MLSGSESSSSTSPTPPAKSRSRSSARRPAHSISNGAPGTSASISRISRASPVLSSIRRTRCICFFLLAVRRQGYDRKPEGIDRLHHHDELLQVDGLGDEIGRASCRERV